MTTVPLYGDKAAGYIAQVDIGDYDLVMEYRWNVWGPYAKGPGQKPIGPYAITTLWIDGRKVTIRMHNLITGWPRVDHADGDGLNNQRYNLREATQAQNRQNSTPNLNAVSQYKGVTLRHRQPLRPWVARITIDGKLRYLGSFADEIAAAMAYDAAAQEAFGQFCLRNFPVE